MSDGTIAALAQMLRGAVGRLRREAARRFWEELRKYQDKSKVAEKKK